MMCAAATAQGLVMFYDFVSLSSRAIGFEMPTKLFIADYSIGSLGARVLTGGKLSRALWQRRSLYQLCVNRRM